MTYPHAPEDPNLFLQNFGARIAARRREIGLSQEALAYKSNLSTSTVSQCERGILPLNLKRIPDLAKALDWSVAQLFDSFV